ncbi:MAG: hypothetical protein GY842_08050, partial [bacterium]|nr:hypothetical protein [bacterium]
MTTMQPADLESAGDQQAADVADVHAPGGGDALGRPAVCGGPGAVCESHSGALERPLHEIHRPAVTQGDAKTELEAYKLALRKYAPAAHGLPWVCEAHCVRCGEVVPARFIREEDADSVV